MVQKKAATEVISGKNKIAHAIARFQFNIKEEWCACVDSSIPAFSMSEGIRQGYVSAKKRGVKIRYITEITAGNLKHCRELVKYVELRHIAGVRCSFAVSETEFVAGIRGKNALAKLVYSNVNEVVLHQREAFETLWENAAPALQRIKDLSS